MKKNISETLENSNLLLIGSKYDIIKKYSLKDRDYRGDRFKDIPHDLLGYNEILSITKPKVISEIDERFLKSGADIIITNTANASRYHLKEYGLEDITYELNLASAKLVRDKISKYSNITRNKPRFTAGCVSNLPDELEFDYLQSVYSEQIKALLAGKVDVILFQKINNEKSLKAGLSALNDILARRNKTQEVIISIDNDEMSEWLYNKDLMDDFKYVVLVAVGQFPFDENVYSQLSEKCPYKVFTLTNFSPDDEQEKAISFIEKYKDNKAFNIVGFNASINPATVDKLIELLNN